MKCNQCNSPMTKDYIPLYNNQLAWLPDNVKLPVLRAPKKNNQIILSDKPAMVPIKKTAYHCPECKTVLIQY